jgi:hypothetical protein
VHDARLMKRMQLGALALAVVAITAGCSNPRCWTHDSSEVEGGCHVFPGAHRPREKTPAEREAEAREAERANLALYERPCVAGDPRACTIVAPIKESMSAPAEEVEAMYATACYGTQSITPRGPHVSCRKAGEYARRRGPKGMTAAIQRYTIACEGEDAVACATLARLVPAEAVAHLRTACALNHHDSCVALVKRHADPEHSDHRAFMALGCRRKIDDACDLLGRFETITKGRASVDAACAQGERRACIQVGRETVSDAAYASQSTSAVPVNPYD